jgi:hypothetical protein
LPNVASWDDVRQLALAMPQTSEAPSHEGLAGADLEELIVEAWLDRAPKRLAKQYLGGAL